MSKATAFILLRPETLGLIDSLVKDMGGQVNYFEDNQPLSMEDAIKRLKEMLGWNSQVSIYWIICGSASEKPTGEIPCPPQARPDHCGQGGLSEILTAWAWLDYINGAFDWSIVSWGSNYTGLMIAITCDQIQLDRVLRDPAKKWMVVAVYSQSEITQRTQRGGIFKRPSELRGNGIWSKIVKTAKTPIALQGMAAEPARTIEGTSRLLERVASVFGCSTRYEWLSIESESAFLNLARSPFTRIIVCGDLSPTEMERAIKEFEEVDMDIFRFGLVALKSATWIYIPQTVRDRNEILIHNDEARVADFLKNEHITKGCPL